MAVMGWPTFNILRNLHSFSRNAKSLHSHQQWKRISFSTSSPASNVSDLFDMHYAHRCKVVFHCDFDLWWWTYSNAFWPSICLPWRSAYLALLSIFWCFLLTWMIFADPCMSPLLDAWCANIFSHSIAGFYILIMVPFTCLYFPLISLLLKMNSKRHQWGIYQRVFGLYFLLQGGIYQRVLGYIFFFLFYNSRSYYFVPLELIVVYSVR